MTNKIAIMLGALALVSPAWSTARAEDRAARPAPPDMTAYEFEDEMVTGDTLGPDVEVLTARRHGERQSLIEPRLHYVPEILKSVEAL